MAKGSGVFISTSLAGIYIRDAEDAFRPGAAFQMDDATDVVLSAAAHYLQLHGGKAVMDTEDGKVTVLQVTIENREDYF